MEKDLHFKRCYLTVYLGRLPKRKSKDFWLIFVIQKLIHLFRTCYQLQQDFILLRFTSKVYQWQIKLLPFLHLNFRKEGDRINTKYLKICPHNPTYKCSTNNIQPKTFFSVETSLCRWGNKMMIAQWKINVLRHSVLRTCQNFKYMICINNSLLIRQAYLCLGKPIN